MARRLGLLIATVVVLAVTAVPVGVSTAAPTENCEQWQQKLGICTSGSSDGHGVDVVGVGHIQDPGTPSGPGDSTSGRPLTDAELLALLDDICVGDGHCDAIRTGLNLNPLLPPGTPGNTTPGAPATTITITDLARFLPAAATLHAEPNGWAVVGVPANFYADSRAATVDGELLGESAQVHFTPVAYRFDYGDGTTRTSSSAGASWASLGRQELTATPTSHVYRERADRHASVTVVYSAEYRFAGGPWIPVAGAVSGTTPPQRVLVVVEKTALTTPA